MTLERLTKTMQPRLNHLNGWAAALVAAASVQVLSAGEISGKVKLNGTPPPEASMKMTDPACSKERGSDTIFSRHYVVGADNGLGNVFVYIKEGAAPKPPATAEGPVLDQVKCEYVPYMLGMQVGQKLKIKNSDPTLHNVHAQGGLNPATGKYEREYFNIGQPVKGMVTEKVFDKPELFVRFKCDVHPWMFAYLAVLEHPYFAVTDKDGHYKISGLPAGNYTLEFLHLKAGSKTQQVSLGETESKTVDITLDVPAKK